MSTHIHKTAIVHPNVELGENVTIEAYAVIGSPAEHRSFKGSLPNKVFIGNDCVIREFCTVNAGTLGPTVLENNIWMLRGSHVGHDAYVEDDCTLSCNAVVGGHARIFRGSNLGLNSTIHQWCAFPSYSILGMNGAFTKKSAVVAGSVYMGVPARRVKENIKLTVSKRIKTRDIINECERINEWIKRQQKQ